MARAIHSTAGGLIVADATLEGSVRSAAHDGDTIAVKTAGGFGVRFLGIDTPEISFTLPGSSRFVGIAKPEWEAFLADPFAKALPAFKTKLGAGLRAWLKRRVGAGVAANHARHAERGQRALEALIEADATALGRPSKDAPLFLAFAFEALDRYGRMLAFIHPSQPGAKPADRLASYNERQLVAGVALPYFIWPNVDPFLRDRSALTPAKLRKALARASSLQASRRGVKAARERGIGVFAKDDPLRLAPFELRFLAGRRAPERWVIDLAATDGRLHRPQSYFQIPNDEDRLYLPSEMVPLFVENGWKRR